MTAGYGWFDSPTAGFQPRGTEGSPRRAAGIFSFLTPMMLSTGKSCSFKCTPFQQSVHPLFLIPDFYCADAALQGRIPLNLSARLIFSNPLHDLILRWERRLSIPIHCFLFESVFFTEKQIRFNEQLADHEDWDCSIKYFSLKPRICHIDRTLAVYRIHSSSMARNRRRMADGFRMALILQRRKYPLTSTEMVAHNLRKCSW